VDSPEHKGVEPSRNAAGDLEHQASRSSIKSDLDKAFSSTVQYIYFLRFSLLFWVSLPVLAYLDAHKGLSALTRGIFTPPVDYAFGVAEFFIICLGMVSLLTARIVCIHGADRFVTAPPKWIQKTLGNDSEAWAWPILIMSQLPGAYVIYRYHWNAHIEHAVLNQRRGVMIEVFWSLVGVLAAISFWRFVNAFYYWASCQQPHPRRSPTLLWPLHHTYAPSRVQFSKTPFALKPLLWLFRFIAAREDGYRRRGEEALFESHQLAAVGALSYLALYFILAPLTAPTPQPRYTALFLAILTVILACIAWGVAQVPVSGAVARTHRNRLIVASALTSAICLAAACIGYFHTPIATHLWFEHFPVISAIAVLFTLLAFIVCGIAFWADRHRIPVFTLCILVLAALHLSFHSDEHLFHSKSNAHIVAVDPPTIFAHYADVVCHNQRPCPLIIVTASGGGIHAAAWTSTVLTELERQFYKNNPSFSFHDHLLLLSSVSGGSVGILPFLREYYAPKAFDSTRLPCPPGVACDLDPIWIGQVRRAAACSSLGGVGWGLEYGDLFRLFAPEVLSAARWVGFTSIDQLTDRSQTLEDTFARNLKDKACNPAYGEDRFGSDDGFQKLTLAQMSQAAASSQIGVPRIPAFSFNSTVAETGGRFLFANYVNGHYGYPTFGVAPGQSWLAGYDNGKSAGLDLSLITAARLSATFPYVSSAARLAEVDISPPQHYIDGGYFDNDGTSTAVEFLEQLFPPDRPSDQRETQGHVIGDASVVKDVPVASILFVEVRDGSDLDPTTSDEQWHWKSNPEHGRTWSPASQLAAPPEAFWNAGHSSITKRNRRELELLMANLQSRGVATFRHLVFDYQPPTHLRRIRREQEHQAICKMKSDSTPQVDHEAAQPLSWHLTPNQQDDIRESYYWTSACSARATDWSRTYTSATSDPTLPRSPEVECDRAMSKPVICRGLGK